MAKGKPMKTALVAIMLCAATSAWAATASWTGSAEADGYRLYRAAGTCAAPGPFTLIETYGAVTQGPVQNPTSNGVYCYRLTAYNFAGESAVSNAVELRSIVNPPLAPQNLTVTP